MKRISQLIVASILCIALLTVGITILNNNSVVNNDAATPLPTATPTINTATSSINTTDAPTSNVTFSYHEDSRTEVGNSTRLSLSINASLINGDLVTIDYSKFLLYVWIQDSEGVNHLMLWHHFNPADVGTVTLDNSNITAIFTLSFEFPTRVMGFDGYLAPFSTYTLSYNGQSIASK